LTVVERNEGKMRHELVSPDKPKVTVATYCGLFTLMMEVPTWQQEYTYDQDLAQFIPLKVGERIHVNATTKNSLNRATPAITIEMTVMGAESIRIGACDYPVFKIDSRTQLVGYRQRVVIRYYDPASMLTLRNVQTIPAAATASPQAIDTRIVKLE
jgi:hypothetical protein